METLTATGYGRTTEDARLDAESQLTEMIRSRDETQMVGGWIVALVMAFAGLTWALWNAMLRPVAGVPVVIGFGLAISFFMGAMQAMMMSVENLFLMVLISLFMVAVLLGLMVAMGRAVPAAILRVERWEARFLAAALDRSPRLGASLHALLLVATVIGGWVMAVYLARLLSGFGLGDPALAPGYGIFGAALALAWRCWRHPLIQRIGAWRILREGFAVARAPLPGQVS